MDIVLMIISILLIAICLLQSSKAESASNILQGGGSELFSNRKERGGELIITRITFILGMLFFVVSFLLSTGIIK